MNKIFYLLFVVTITAGCHSVKQETINAYLEHNIIKPAKSGKIFSAYEIYGKDKIDGKINIYMWVFCKEYYVSFGELKSGAEESAPVDLIAEKSGDDYKIVAHKKPWAGIFYIRTFREMFPGEYHKALHPNTGEYSKRNKNLEETTKQQAMEYFKKND